MGFTSDAATGIEFGNAVWSPTRNEIAFWTTIAEHSECATAGQVAPQVVLFVVRPDGSELRRIAPARDAPSSLNAVREGPPKIWSPDGNLLALTLSTPSPHTEDLSVLVATRSGEMTLPSMIAAEPTSWAPDSERLAVYEYDPTNSPTGPAVLDLRHPRRYAIGPYISSDLGWSPRGDLVAYEHGGYVYVERPNATKRHRLTTGVPADWSGDGTLLAFVRRRGKKWSSGYVMRPNGRNIRRMPGGPADWVWSPRGRTYAFGRELYDLATGRRWRVLPRTVEVSEPIWSANGRRLAYPGAEKLFVVDRSGRHGHVIRWPRAARVSDPSWSPDGRMLAFTTVDGLYVVGVDGRHARYVPLRLCD